VAGLTALLAFAPSCAKPAESSIGSPPPPTQRTWNLAPDAATSRAVLRQQLARAAGRGELARVCELLARGAEVNGPGDRGASPALYEAVRYGRTDTANALLDAGARADGEMLASAVDSPNPSPVLLLRLVQAGGDVHWRDRQERTPLYLATLWNHRPAAAVLLDQGAEVDAGRGADQTPLHAAAEQDAVQVAGLLLDRGANPNARAGGSQATPLHVAAARGSWQVARLLIARGAGIDLKDAEGRTPADLAQANDQPAVARVLAERRSAAR
jgi:ankyrin repeat protein